MEQKNSAKSKLDSKSFGSRAKELRTISIFTVLAALLSVALMDLIIFPLTMFAINDVPKFNFMIKLLFAFIVAAFLIMGLVSTVRSLRRNSHNTAYIILYLIKKPLYHLGLFLFILALSAILIAIIYFFFSLNYYYLHRLAGGA